MGSSTSKWQADGRQVCHSVGGTLYVPTKGLLTHPLSYILGQMHPHVVLFYPPHQNQFTKLEPTGSVLSLTITIATET